MRTAFGLISAFALASFMGTASAQRVPRPPTTEPQAIGDRSVEEHLNWRGSNYRAVLNASRSGSKLQLFDARGRSVWETTIPSTALAMIDTLSLESDVEEVAGQRDLLNLLVTGISTSDLQARFRVVIDTDSRGNLRTLWQGREAANEPGDTLVVRDLNGDREDEIVLFARSPQVYHCGMEQAPLFPRVYDRREGVFRPISLRPAVPSSAVEATLKEEIPTRRFSNDTALESVSTNDDRISGRSYGRAPRALSDSNPDTVWKLPISSTVGAFVTAHVNPYARLRGVSFERPSDGPLPRFRALISVSDGSVFTVEVPAGFAKGMIELPEAVNTTCATLSIVEWDRNRAHLAFAEIAFHSSLDVGDITEIVNHEIIDPYIAADSAVDRIRIANLLNRADENVVRAIDARFDEIPAGAQAPIVEALLRTPYGRDAVYVRLTQGNLSPSSIAAVGRALTRDESGSREIRQILDSTKDEAARVALIRVLSRSVTQKDALTLLPLLEDVTESSRADLAFGLGQALFTDIDTLIQSLGANKESDLVVLRAVARISGRVAGRQRANLSESSLQKLNEAMDHENGTIARVAYKLAGSLGVESLRDRLLSAITSDPSGPIRLAALQGLAFYDEHFLDDGPNNAVVLETLSDHDPSMRIAAANILRERTVSETEVDFVLDALRREIWPDAQRSLVVALVRQSRPDIDLRVADAIVHRGDLALARAAFVNWQARQAVAPMSAILKLETMAKTNESSFIAMVRSTARIDEPSAHEAMTRWLEEKSGDVRLRSTVIEAMGRQRHLGHLPTLTHILAEDGGVDARRAAARALAWYEGNRSAREALLNAKAEERNPQVLESVEYALRAIEQAQYTRELLDVRTPAATED